MPYIPEPTPPNITSLSMMLTRGTIPPSGMKESCHPLMAPQLASVVTVANSAELVMPHQAVEVEWGCRAHVSLEIDHFRLAQRRGGELAGNPGGFFKRGAVGHVHDHLKFALVVEGQHLDLDELEVEERTRAHEQEHDTGEEAPTQGCVVQDCAHHATVNSGDEIFPLPVPSFVRRQIGRAHV